MSPSAGWLLFALAGGMALAVQAGLNGGLGRLLGHPLWATLTSLAVSVATVVPVILILRLKLPAADVAARAPWWLWTGGVLGAFFVTGAIVIAPRIGATSYLLLVFVGQMVMAVLTDRFGLFGFAARPVNPVQILGVLGTILAATLALGSSRS